MKRLLLAALLAAVLLLPAVCAAGSEAGLDMAGLATLQSLPRPDLYGTLERFGREPSVYYNIAFRPETDFEEEYCFGFIRFLDRDMPDKEWSRVYCGFGDISWPCFYRESYVFSLISPDADTKFSVPDGYTVFILGPEYAGRSFELQIDGTHERHITALADADGQAAVLAVMYSGGMHYRLAPAGAHSLQPPCEWSPESFPNHAGYGTQWRYAMTTYPPFFDTADEDGNPTGELKSGPDEPYVHDMPEIEETVPVREQTLRAVQTSSPAPDPDDENGPNLSLILMAGGGVLLCAGVLILATDKIRTGKAKTSSDTGKIKNT